jgi:NAD(P)-dependent dehydrogenase (short-subunit alcohol dehydrogenase family)
MEYDACRRHSIFNQRELSMNTCKDRAALITGAAGSIGRSTALTLAREGAKVVVNYRTSEAMASSIVEHVRTRGGMALAVEFADHGPGWQNRTGLCPQDIAEGIAFLCSEAGRFISGSELTYESK